MKDLAMCLRTDLKTMCFTFSTERKTKQLSYFYSTMCMSEESRFFLKGKEL